VPNQTPPVWTSLGLNDTPRIPLDEATLIAMDDEATIVGDLPVCVQGDPVDIIEDLQGAPLHLAADIVGADGSILVESIITRLSVWLRKTTGSVPPTEPPENEPLPPYDPGSCDVALVLDDMNYASLAALNAEWPVV